MLGSWSSTFKRRPNLVARRTERRTPVFVGTAGIVDCRSNTEQIRRELQTVGTARHHYERPLKTEVPDKQTQLEYDIISNHLLRFSANLNYVIRRENKNRDIEALYFLHERFKGGSAEVEYALVPNRDLEILIKVFLNRVSDLHIL